MSVARRAELIIVIGASMSEPHTNLVVYVCNNDDKIQLPCSTVCLVGWLMHAQH